MAVLYTLLANCHLHQVDPQAYLTDVVVKLQDGWPMSRIDELLPQFWKYPRAEPKEGSEAQQSGEAEAAAHTGDTQDVAGL